MVAIVDYGMGNLGSIQNMLLRIGAPCVITSDPDSIRSAKRLILPGVGAFDHAMSNLKELGIVPLLNELVEGKRVPILGICLGMQILTKSSEEGVLPGLGWIDAQTVRFRFEGELAKLRVPHMGWNKIEAVRPDAVLNDLPLDPRFYFVHTYHVCCKDPADILARTTYGIPFHSVIRKGNVMGVQFHPEKSHKFGLALLKNFLEIGA